MFELKKISKEAIPHALERADRYRLLNDSAQAESIYRDVLEVDPDNQKVILYLALSITDQFGEGASATVKEARGFLERVEDAYLRAYYGGLICERWGMSKLRQGRRGAGYAAYDWLREAMENYEKAADMRPEGNDEALLRHNSCARTINQNSEVRPQPEDDFVPFLE